MKKTAIIGILFLIVGVTGFAQVAINDTNTEPDASSLLDVQSTNKGFLLPRLADTNAVSSPAEGLMAYDLSSHCMRYYAGSHWSDCIGLSGSSAPSYPSGSVHCIPNGAAIVDVTNAATGETWMDRNLEASQQATSSTDADAYGALYQWGRASEGHQCRNSGTTSTNATTSVPNAGNAWDGKFIMENSAPNDWLTPQDDNLWQGANGTNNPCPGGYRLPTETELNAERQSWSSNDASGAYASPLKLTLGGYRKRNNGALTNVGSQGLYSSSTVSSTKIRYLHITGSNASMYSQYRANGYSVRCIKD